MGQPIPEALDREHGQEGPGESTVPQLHDGTILTLSSGQLARPTRSLKVDPQPGGPSVPAAQ